MRKAVILLFLVISWGSAPMLNAQVNLDSLFTVWNNKDLSDSNRLEAIESIAWYGYLFDNPDSASYYSKLHFKLAKACLVGDQNNEDFYLHHMALSLNTQGTAYYFRGEYEKSLDFYKQSLRLRKQIGNKKDIASSLKNIATIYGEQSNYEEASRMLNQSLEIYEEIDDQAGMAAVYNNLGIVYKSQGLFAEAINQYDKALVIFQETKNKRFASAALNNIANIYRSQHDYTNSLHYFRKSLKLREELQDNQGIVTSLNNIGNAYLREGNLLSHQSRSTIDSNDLLLAEEYFNKAHKLAQEIGNQKELALALNGIGQVAIENMEFDSAISYFQQALNIRKDLGKKAGIASSLNLLANGYLQKAKATNNRSLVSNAITQAKRSLSIAQEVHHLNQTEQSAHTLYECYKWANNPTKSLEMYELYVNSRDSLLSEENQRALIHQEYRYAYEKKAITDSIAMLVERQTMKNKEDSMNAEIASQVNIIQLLISAFLITLAIGLIYRLNERRKKLAVKAEANELRFQTAESEMKALRSQMNPHFIFNALQSIQAFLLEQKNEDANEFLLKFSKLMRAVLENSEKDEVFIEKEKKALELYMELESIRLKHPFTFDIDIHSSIDIEGDTLPPLILQPVVENAIWHGLQHKDMAGHIQIEMRKIGSDIICSVEDNGIGRAANKSLKQDWHIKRESLGMKITSERIRVRNELTGTHGSVKIVDLESNEGKALGTKVELIIPCVA